MFYPGLTGKPAFSSFFIRLIDRIQSRLTVNPDYLRHVYNSILLSVWIKADVNFCGIFLRAILDSIRVRFESEPK